MKNIFKFIIIFTTVFVSSCRSNDPNSTSKIQFTKPVNTYLSKRSAPAQLSAIEPAAGGSTVDKNNSHLDPKNSIYWQREYYFQNPYP
jgi:hypothetical protein